MQKKKLTDKELKEIINNFPEPVFDYWMKNSGNLPIETLQAYTTGFHDGMGYVIKNIRPNTKRIE
jgi:hypothetical protein